MKIAIDTVTYRVTNKQSYSRIQMQKLEKKIIKAFPQTLWVSNSSDLERVNDILISACNSISMNKLKELIG